MEAIVDKIHSFFTGGDIRNWTDPGTVLHYKSLVDSSERCSDSMKNMHLLWYKSALVHSKEPKDVQCGINMLEGLLDDDSQKDVHLYLLAVGYFRKGDYEKSKAFVDHCLMISAEWEEPIILKKLVERRLKKGGVTGIAAITVGVVAVGLVAVALSRRKGP
ncbi:hypothetical protein QVD17_37569 [Tagetes erecta]|uniref:Mitochondrial fission 1 protein n=1 Tax=Tagetes erecta TaxID=13708 RepID=A0AAD8K0R8_TARER|nr:hypothetical protein QVD17_37569 [Tagetes erecta]